MKRSYVKPIVNVIDNDYDVICESPFVNDVYDDPWVSV